MLIILYIDNVSCQKVGKTLINFDKIEELLFALDDFCQ